MYELWVCSIKSEVTTLWRINCFYWNRVNLTITKVVIPYGEYPHQSKWPYHNGLHASSRIFLRQLHFILVGNIFDLLPLIQTKVCTIVALLTRQDYETTNHYIPRRGFNKWMHLDNGDVACFKLSCFSNKKYLLGIAFGFFTFLFLYITEDLFVISWHHCLF